MSLRKRHLVLVTFIVLLSFSMLYGQTKIIINASDLPPLGSPNLEGNGILPQFISESFIGKNYSIEYKFLPYARVLEYMEKDTLGAGIFNSLRANDKLYNMKPIINCSVVFFYKKSKFPKGLPFNELKDLKQYSIGIVRGAPTIKKFEDAGLTLDLVRNEALNFKKLQANRVDLVTTGAIHFRGTRKIVLDSVVASV
jgi:polar amino acid transport system substrate-binding protein